MRVLYSWHSFVQGFRLDMESLITNVHPAVIAACFAVLTALFLLVDRKHLRGRYILYAVLAAAYGTFLLTITLLGRAGGNESSWDRLFAIYVRAFSGDLGAAFDILYNIVLFIPAGVLAFRWRTKYALIGLAVIPLCIEIAQLITSRGVFEIADIINNFIGGAIGLFLARMVGRFYRSVINKS